MCGFPLSDTLPPTYVHMLAFPLHLALMTDGSFPLPAIGLVHIANRIVQHRPLEAAERAVAAGVGDADLPASARPPVHDPHRGAGRRRAGVGGGVDEPARAAARRLGHAAPAPPSSEDLPATATWRLPGDLGRRYGSVSGDLNPIHVHPLTARLFGFPSAIAHGMWTKARCLAALGPSCRRRSPSRWRSSGRSCCRPRSQFAEAAAADEIAFGVRDARKATPHLDGLVTARSTASGRPI